MFDFKNVLLLFNNEAFGNLLSHLCNILVWFKKTD